MNILYEQCKNLVDPSLPSISNVSNLLAFLFYEINDINWIGFYLVDPKEDVCLLGPFQGKVACTKIPFGKGVVGHCAITKEIHNISDVHSFPGHIACDCASNSELVIPIFNQNRLIAILDIDSPVHSRFDPELYDVFVTISKLFTSLISNLHLL